MSATLAAVTPPACSGCFQQKLTTRHVDFNVAWDGPPAGGGMPYPIDDLILCEACLADAGKLVGLGYVEDAERLAAEAQKEAEAAYVAALAAESKLQALETALEVLRVPVPEAKPKRAKKPAEEQA